MNCTLIQRPNKTATWSEFKCQAYSALEYTLWKTFIFEEYTWVEFILNK